MESFIDKLPGKLTIRVLGDQRRVYRRQEAGSILSISVLQLHGILLQGHPHILVWDGRHLAAAGVEDRDEEPIIPVVLTEQVEPLLNLVYLGEDHPARAQEQHPVLHDGANGEAAVRTPLHYQVEELRNPGSQPGLHLQREDEAVAERIHQDKEKERPA